MSTSPTRSRSRRRGRGGARALLWPASLGVGLVAGVLAWVFTSWVEGVLIGAVVGIWFALVVARPTRPSRVSR